MQIAICDDNISDLNNEYDVCKQYFDRLGYFCEIDTYMRGDDLLRAKKIYDLIILDIEMPEKNGIYIKEKLGCFNAKIYIIFVTDHMNYMPNAFGENVLGYISKYNFEKQIEHYLKLVISKLGGSVTLGNGISSDRVMYIKSEHVYCILYLDDGTSKLERRSITDYERKLDTVGFLRVHKSFLVNLAYVREIRKNKIYIYEVEIPISVRRNKYVNDQYIKYCQSLID